MKTNPGKLIRPIIKWETSPGHIVEHELFGAESEFNMIVAVRLGNNPKGKSTILNQMLSTNTIFSRCGEPGAIYGKPVTLDGSVEFVWLTEETCSAGLWQSIKEHYSHNASNKIILLANLHGNALQYPDQLKLLKQLASSFIAFIMPDIENDLERYWQQFIDIIDDSDSSTPYVCVDPREDSDEPEDKKIFTSSLMDDITLNKMKNIVLSALYNPYNKNKRDVTSIQSFSNTIQLTPKIETIESQRLIDFIKKRSCQKIRNMMEFQNKNMSANECIRRWESNTELQKLIPLYADILMLPLSSRRYALIHLEREISQLFNVESSRARADVAQHREELQRTLKLSIQDDVRVRQIKKQMNNALKRVDEMSLGLEHFFRELAKIYQISATLAQNNDKKFKRNSYTKNSDTVHTMTKLAEKYAELLIDGHAIELLNGDAGEISGPWLTAICNNINHKYPNLRIFVISIIGLQSSGKSTLLNALFGCKFAVSVGRCTRGLFLRLLFLNKELKERLNVDAFLLIDTEGLGAPEKINDKDAEQKDRLLATFAMGVSNLIIINVLGEYMNSLTEILQIAIVTMARLEEAELSPDIMLVQHMNERNQEKLQQGLEQFREALDKAFELADKDYMAVGIKNLKSLAKLMERIQTGQLLHQFPPFKSGPTVFAPPSDMYHKSIVDLYDKIIASCNASVPFNRWHKSVKSYWDAVSREDFALRFKNIKQFYEFLERGTYIANVKEHYECAFRHHVEEELKPLLKNCTIGMNRCENSTIDMTREPVLKQISEMLKCLPKMCKLLNDSTCAKCQKAVEEEVALFDYVANKEWENDTRMTINKFMLNLRQSNVTLVTQMYDSMVIQNGCSLEFSTLIDHYVKYKLENCCQFDEQARMAIVEEIWSNLIQKAAQRSTVRPVDDQIEDELKREYEQIKDIYDIYLRRNNTVDNLFQKTAKKYKKSIIPLSFRTDHKLDNTQVNILTEKIDGLSDKILSENNVDHYQTGMVSQLKHKIEQVIQEFEKNFKVKLFDSYKWDIHVHALHKFEENMIRKQNSWDKKNKPINILCQKEQYYKDIINTRLQYGYSLDGEGRVIGDLLLKGIAYYAKTASEEERISSILAMPQLSNPQNIRLMYFSQLAKSNDKYRVLNHFHNPKESIDNWFISEVNSSYKDRAQQTYSDRFKGEYDMILNAINDPSKDLIEIKKCVSQYLENADGFNYDDQSIESEESIESTTNDASLLRESILKTLKDSNKLQHIKTCVTFKNPSDDSMVMKRLGCTYSCPLCSNLCWGHRDHHTDRGDTNKHHTSHQPFGLSGIVQNNTNVLTFERCGDINPKSTWYRFDERLTWQTFTTKYHSDWKFQKHTNVEFDNLMCWFFVKYQEDIAKMHNCETNLVLPLPLQELKAKTNWESLDLSNILSQIAAELN